MISDSILHCASHVVHRASARRFDEARREVRGVWCSLPLTWPTLVVEFHVMEIQRTRHTHAIEPALCACVSEATSADTRAVSGLQLQNSIKCIEPARIGTLGCMHP